MWQNMNAKQSNKDKICVYSQFFTAMARFPHDSWYFFCDHSQEQPALGIVNTIGIVMKQDPYSGGSLVCRLRILIWGCTITSTVMNKNRHLFSLLKQETISIIFNWDFPQGTPFPKKSHSQTSLIRTPRGQNQVSALQRCPYYRGRECTIFGISGTKGTVRNRQVSIL